MRGWRREAEADIAVKLLKFVYFSKQKAG
jgi:hypothetical protein